MGKKLSPKSLSTITGNYAGLLSDIKQRIRSAQVRTAMASNTSLLMLYWEIGGVLVGRQLMEGWGTAVLPRLAADLKNELPDMQGFSERNMRRMIQFHQEYPELFSIWPPPVAKLEEPEQQSQIWPPPVAKLTRPGMAAGKRPPSLAELTADQNQTHIWQQAVAKLTWAHNIILIQKIKDLPTRLWYAHQAFEHGWSRDALARQIQSRAHKRHGKAITNFQRTLPSAQSELATQILKDPYLFDFLTLETEFHERELESKLLQHIQKFLVELGTGFAFVGNQVPLDIGDDDFSIDLLFYHLRLRCFVVIDLKVGRFKAEYAGKMNLYLNAVDDTMRHPADQPSIGLILCEEKNKIVAEYALRGMDKAIGVSAYQLTRVLPRKLQSALPSIELLEEELSQSVQHKPNGAKKKPRLVVGRKTPKSKKGVRK